MSEHVPCLFIVMDVNHQLLGSMTQLFGRQQSGYWGHLICVVLLYLLLDGDGFLYNILFFTTFLLLG